MLPVFPRSSVLQKGVTGKIGLQYLLAQVVSMSDPVFFAITSVCAHSHRGRHKARGAVES